MSEFSNKAVLITGGSGGIGLEVARSFADQGAIVYIVGRNMQTLTKTKAKLEKTKGRIELIVADISCTEDCKHAVEEVIEKESRLDVLVNSAGIYVEKTIDETTEEVWDNLIQTNLKGTYFMCKYAVPFLTDTKGCIVNIASTAGITGFEGNSLYCASKGGMLALTKALAIECAPRGIRVNAVSPDMVKTEMLDIGFKRSGMTDRKKYDALCLEHYPQKKEDRQFVLPQEVAECVLFLASTGKIRAVTGANIVIDCGLTAGF